MEVLKKTCSEFCFFVISLKMWRRWKSLCGYLGKNPFVYGLFWLSCRHITWSPSLQQTFFLLKAGRIVIPMWLFQENIPNLKILRSIYLTMKRSCSSSCIKEPELCWEVHCKGELDDYTDSTSNIVLETFCKLKLRCWPGLAALHWFVQGAGSAPEPSKHEENYNQAGSMLYLHDPYILYWWYLLCVLHKWRIRSCRWTLDLSHRLSNTKAEQLKVKSYLRLHISLILDNEVSLPGWKIQCCSWHGF